jgi:hypothetical protein
MPRIILLVDALKEAAKKVSLLASFDAESISIGKDRYFSKAYVIDLPLGSTPDHVWLDMFDREWRSSRHMWDRKLFVIDDKLRLVTPLSDIEDKLDWVKQIVDETNKGIDEYNREEAAREAQLEEEKKQQALEEEKRGIGTIRNTKKKDGRRLKHDLDSELQFSSS